MKPIDLRSDTVTRPTAAMRQAMASAEVGDDVYGEDPSVNRLQDTAAERFGKQAALFVPSGTMGNQACIHAFTRPGDLVLAPEGAHLLVYEVGAAAAISGVQIQTLGTGGLFDGSDVRAAATPASLHHPRTRLLCIENTHNRAGGRVFPLERLRDAVAAARELGLSTHLDGARIFNAVVATGIPAATWAAPFDSVTFCLSKGLGAPVGSVICGDSATIDLVRRSRKLLGGGMRQAGILAAAGQYALEHHVERLAEDHANARRLADGLAARGFAVEGAPETNMVMFRATPAAAFAQGLSECAVLINPMGSGRFRAVTHLDVSRDDIDEALDRITAIRKSGAS